MHIFLRIAACLLFILFATPPICTWRTQVALKDAVEVVGVEEIDGKNIPDSFPVLVTSCSNTAQPTPVILTWAKIEELKRNGAKLSFSLEPTKLTELQPKILANAQLNPHDPGNASALIKETDGSKILLEVEYEWDGDSLNRGWYWLEDGQIKPIKHQSLFGPGLAIGLAFGGAFQALIIASVLAVMLWFILRYFFPQKKPAPSRAPAL